MSLRELLSFLGAARTKQSPEMMAGCAIRFALGDAGEKSYTPEGVLLAKAKIPLQGMDIEVELQTSGVVVNGQQGYAEIVNVRSAGQCVLQARRGHAEGMGQRCVVDHYTAGPWAMALAARTPAAVPAPAAVRVTAGKQQLR